MLCALDHSSRTAVWGWLFLLEPEVIERVIFRRHHNRARQSQNPEIAIASRIAVPPDID